MYLLVALFVTLGQILGITSTTKPLTCVDRLTFVLRQSDSRVGCLMTERSLGASPIIKAKVNPTSIHPKVRLRFESARRAAQLESVTLYIASGFRTLERQRFLFDRAVKKYGSESEAAKWVLPPYLSSHPQGLALDINYPSDPSGARWLEENGYLFGLCRIFDNEWWHFEANIAPGQKCPPRLPNASVLLASD